MWLSRVWSERRESHKEQAFKLLKLFLSKETKLFKKSFSYQKKQNRTHSRRRRKGLRLVKKKTKNSELQTDMARRSLWISAWIGNRTKWQRCEKKSKKKAKKQKRRRRKGLSRWRRRQRIKSIGIFGFKFFFFNFPDRPISFFRPKHTDIRPIRSDLARIGPGLSRIGAGREKKKNTWQDATRRSARVFDIMSDQWIWKKLHSHVIKAY